MRAGCSAWEIHICNPKTKPYKNSRCMQGDTAAPSQGGKQEEKANPKIHPTRPLMTCSKPGRQTWRKWSPRIQCHASRQGNLSVMHDANLPRGQRRNNMYVEEINGFSITYHDFPLSAVLTTVLCFNSQFQRYNSSTDILTKIDIPMQDGKTMKVCSAFFLFA